MKLTKTKKNLCVLQKVHFATPYLLSPSHEHVNGAYGANLTESPLRSYRSFCRAPDAPADSRNFSPGHRANFREDVQRAGKCNYRERDRWYVETPLIILLYFYSCI